MVPPIQDVLVHWLPDTDTLPLIKLRMGGNFD